jgi:virulence-associated protein VagC
MSVVAVEGVVHHGMVRLPADLRLPENARVYVVVPMQTASPQPRIVSPRLKHPQDIIDFQMEIVEEPANAAL